MIVAAIAITWIILGATTGYLMGRVHLSADADRVGATFALALVAPLGFIVSVALYFAQIGEQRRLADDRNAKRTEQIVKAKHRLDLAALEDQTAEVRALSDGTPRRGKKS